jgi:hypothetical protein
MTESPAPQPLPVEGQRRTEEDEQFCGVCGLLVELHPRYKTFERLKLAREKYPEAHQFLDPETVRIVRVAPPTPSVESEG